MGSIKSPWSKVSWDSRAPIGAIIAIVVLGIVFILLGLAWLAFLVWVVVINAQDIGHVGANFWNVFWIVLAGLGILGFIGQALRGNR